MVDPRTREFYFLEMNTRLQVEHPITELLTGIDLVKLQLRIAAGETLPFAQHDLLARGHAIECRVYAEDPANGFLPSTGPVLRAEMPVGPGGRVDAGIESGDEGSIHYDPMMAKVNVQGQDRLDAIRKVDWALRNTMILGVTTNIAFLRDVLAHPVFMRGEVTTDFVEREMASWQPQSGAATDLALIAAAMSEMERGVGSAGRGVGDAEQEVARDPWQASDGFRVGG